MSYDPITTGEAPITWTDGPEPAAAPGETERRLGPDTDGLADVLWVPDALAEAVAAGGRPFNGAHVPLVVHDPHLSERSYDAAEWAAELIRDAGGRHLSIVPYAEQGFAADAPLSRRQWNHTAAMLERLDDLCVRHRITAVVVDTVGDDPARDDERPEADLHHAIDAGSFVADGYVAVRLASPEKVVAESNLTDRLRDFLRNRA